MLHDSLTYVNLTFLHNPPVELSNKNVATIAVLIFDFSYSVNGPKNNAVILFITTITSDVKIY